MGRPKDLRIWEHYRTLPNKSVSCKLCNKVYKFSNAAKMLQHLITCPKSPETLKDSMKLIKDSSSKTKMSGLSEIETNDSFISPSSSANTTINAEFQDTDDHIKTELARAIFVTGTPLSMVQHPLWIQFFEKLQPKFKIPSRKALATKYLDKIYREMRFELNEEINACSYLHLQCDGWSNLRNEGIINFLISKPQPAYVKSLNTESNPHTSEYLSQEVEKVMKVYGANKFLVLIGDNARNIQKAFELTKLKYPHVVPLGCCAHILNLLCQDIVKIQEVTVFIMQAINIIKTVKRSQRLSSLLIKSRQGEDSTQTLKLPCATRWGSHVTSLKSLKANKIALQILTVREDVVISRDIKDLILSDDFWTKTGECISILEPVTESIFYLESDQNRLHRTYITFRDVQAKIRFALNEISTLSEESKQQILTSVSSRCNMAMRPIHFAAYILDPRTLGVELTQEEELKGMEFIYNLSQHLSLSNVMADLACYKAKENFWARGFVWSSLDSIEPLIWWKGICGSTELSKVAIRILSAPCTSAATERSFSIQGYIHNNKRNRLTTERTEKISFICYNWNLKHKAECEDIQFNEENTLEAFIEQVNEHNSLDEIEPIEPIQFIACNNSESDSD
ncbi:uncharacterized protein LOC128201007 [Galleria mellonella]|uniref:Uncharacterized protein LOC128201007 n=1 Tax=Galleria mellonella TaxID=7137 RepID=A0ABM3MM10_GALME|nr:uncharacterized protein LOC128201007 [Galleria mellonella]